MFVKCCHQRKRAENEGGKGPPTKTEESACLRQNSENMPDNLQKLAKKQEIIFHF